MPTSILGLADDFDVRPQLYPEDRRRMEGRPSAQPPAPMGAQDGASERSSWIAPESSRDLSTARIVERPPRASRGDISL